MKKSIAVILTCHNRKQKTITCLNALFGSMLPDHYGISVYLVDDGSTDGTTEAVSLNFPQVNIIKGDGSLFWNQGMRLAWESAVKSQPFDYYLWLNDDTIIDEDAITHLVLCSEEAKTNNRQAAIIVSSCRNEEKSNVFSYGGKNDSEGPVLPNGSLQECRYMNGNLVLIPNTIYKVLGNLSNKYTHGMGDYDYGLRAISAGFKLYVSKKFIATCPVNEGIPGWCNPNNSLKKRWQLLHSPLGLNIEEYKVFKKQFWPNQYYATIIKAYSKCIFPTFYSYLKKNN